MNWSVTKLFAKLAMVGGVSLLVVTILIPWIGSSINPVELKGQVVGASSSLMPRPDSLQPQGLPTQPINGWHWQRGGTFSDIEFSTPGTGWFGGDVLIKATRYWDGSWGWHQQAYDFTDQHAISDLDFYNQYHGWALASDGTIICTADGGVSWQLFPKSMDGMDISRLEMTGPGRGYAIAQSNDQEATVLYSDNCGASWQVVRRSGNFATILGDIKMYSSQIGVAVGYRARPGTGIYWWTEDGWQTARVQEVSKPLWKATVPTSESFYALHGDYMIYFNRVQLDTEISLPSGFSASDFYFSSLSNGWLVGSTAPGYLEVLHTNNGGETWSRQSFENPTTRLIPYVITGSDGGSLYVSGITRINTGAFFAMSSGVILSSDDGGNAWNRVESLSSVQPEQFSLATQAGQHSPGMLVGWLGRSKASLKLSAGVWYAPTIVGDPDYPPLDPWGGVAMIDSLNAWATSSREGDSMLMHTTNGGRNWTQPTNSQFGGGGPIYALDTEHIWAMFYNKPWDQSVTLVKSPNGGGNWYAGADNVYRPSHLYTNDGTNGWVVNNNSLLRTTDGGVTFQGTHVCGIDDIDWIDGNNGWVLCGRFWDSVNQQAVFEVKQTQDGGNTWQTITEFRGPSGESYANLNFQSTQVGYVNHYRGNNVFHILKTEDGGITWNTVPDGLSYSDFIFLEVGLSGQGWAVSKSGAILYLGPWQSRQSIGAAGGGIASADGGRLQIIVPANAVSADTEFSLQTFESAVDGAYILPYLYQLSLDPAASLARPLELTAYLTPDPMLNADRVQALEYPTFVIWQDNVWQPLADSTYDASTGLLAATTQSAGILGIKQPAQQIFAPILLSP